MNLRCQLWFVLSLCGIAFGSFARSDGRVQLKVYNDILPTPGINTVQNIALQKIIARFEELNPDIHIVSSTGLKIEGKEEVITLMQIAADIAPDVIFVNFRNSDSYIQQRFLYPLDEYVQEIPAEKLKDRVPDSVWPIMRRAGPDEKTHVWAFPIDNELMTLSFRKDIFKEAGLDPNRPPQNWAELEDYCRKISMTTNKGRRRYGMGFDGGDNESWKILSLIASSGSEVVREVSPGQWRANFDSPEAVETFHFYYKLVRQGLVYRGTGLANEIQDLWDRGDLGMTMGYIYESFFSSVNPAKFGLAPLPGQVEPRGGEFNCKMLGIFSGVKDPKVREAAWKFIEFYDGEEARKIRTRSYVENDMARGVNPKFLKTAGFEEYVKDVPAEWVNAYTTSLQYSKPEPFGRNCNLIYKEVTKPIDQIFHDSEIERRWNQKDEAGVKGRIKEILTEAARQTNQRMLDYVSPREKKIRSWVALAVVGAVFTSFFFLFRYILKLFTPTGVGGRTRGWQFKKYWIAYVLLVPAVLTILLWQYIPLFRGSAMAFQNYMIMGGSQWIGLDNFARVLFDPTFWHSLWVTFQYAFWSLSLGFCAPVVLAVLLHEVPRGKVFFRLIYYLPTVVSGLVVIFLWKSFYQKDGLLNQILDFVGLNHGHVWLSDPRFVLIACVLPTVWCQVGPGCLLYLAALKTIPEDIYEAGDLDGANFFQKFIHIVLPSIKSLLVINFIGAFAATFHSSQFILVMTGGGPYTPYGASEVTSLLIFYNAFMYLRFGIATAMAWTLGAMLLGFTVIQLRKLSRMEFKSTEAD